MAHRSDTEPPGPVGSRDDLRPISWGDVFLMGDAQIDAEHKEFVNLVNALNAAISSQAQSAAIVEICRRLAVSVAEHFETEEAVMERHGFAALEAHRQEHHNVLAFVQGEVARVQEAAERTEAVSGALALKARLLEHLFRFDVTYKSLLLSAAGH